MIGDWWDLNTKPFQRAFELDRDGLTLRGMAYLPGPAGGGRRFPSVLMLHGFTGQRMGSGFKFVQLARALSQNKIAAVTFDFLHSGESDGSFDRMLATDELADAVRMTAWLQSQPFADRSRLGLLGFSLGGLLAACLSARDDAYQTLALVAPTTVDNLARLARRGETPAAAGPVSVGAATLHPEFFNDLATLDPLGDCVVHPRPTLIVQGTADSSVAPEVSRQYLDRLRATGVDVSQVLVEGADHSFSHPGTRARLVETVVEWFDRMLKSDW